MSGQMTNTWFISDTHFRHRNIAEVFVKEDGSKVRPFKSLEEQDEAMIKNWNERVKPDDRVYHLGDFTMPRRGLQEVLPRLMGRIYFILGNHDSWKKEDWMAFPNVTHVGGCKQMSGLGWVLTHVPVHERHLQGKWTHNLHGHLHHNRVMERNGKIVDKRYFNCSVEQINYAPIELEELRKLL